jgi:hypothetical protein
VSDKITLTKKDVFGFALIIVLMLGSLVYGFFLLKNKTPENCWGQYTTEDAAIYNCEKHHG